MKGKFIRVLITLVLVLSFSLVTAVPVAAATIYVDDSATGTGDGTSKTDAFTTIQAAIAAASATDEIKVYPGTYAEDLNINKQVTLTGVTEAGANNWTTGTAGAGATAPTIAYGTANNFINVNEASVTIQGFKIDASTFTGMNSGIYWTGARAGTIIRYNTLNADNGDRLINLADGAVATSFTITYNAFTISSGWGNWFATGVNGGSSGANVLSYNSVVGQLTSWLDLGTNNVEDITWSNNDMDYGIVLNETGEQSTGKYGDLVVESNTWAGDPSTSAFEIAADVEDADWEGGGLTTDDVTIRYNDFSGYIDGGNETVRVVNTPTDPLNAEDNWWGSANGPIHTSNTFNVGSQGPADVGDNVDYVPWYDTDMTGSSFAPVNNTTDSTKFSSIQAAIDAGTTGAGDTITVAAGTYEEAVTIDKSLTLNGAKAGVDARTRDTNSGESILDGTSFTGTSAQSAFKIAAGVSSVTIDGFEMRNYVRHPNHGGEGYGVHSIRNTMYGESATVTDVTIHNNYIHDMGWNGIGVWSGSNSDLVQTGFDIQQNLIEEYRYAGIELTNVTSSTVKDNKITAPTVIVNDPGDAGVGIEIAVRAHTGNTVSAGTGILVEDNEISGAFPTGPSSGISRAGINLLSRTYSSTSSATLTGVTVRGNTVSGGGANLRAGILAVAETRHTGATATITNLTVENNTLDGNKDGVEIEDYINGGGTPSHSGISITKNNIINSTAVGVHILSGTSAAGITVNYNSIDGNTAGVTNAGDGTLDAEKNWWGGVAGPVHGDNPYTSEAGTQSNDSVSDDVDFLPWMIHDTLVTGWNIYSTPIAPSTSTNTIAKALDLWTTDTGSYTIGWYFNGATQAWVQVVTATALQPMQAVYLKMTAAATIDVVVSDEYSSPPQTVMGAGWNLVGPASLDEDMHVDVALLSAKFGAGAPDLWGYSQAYSPALHQTLWTFQRVDTYASGQDFVPTEGYWVHMVNPGLLAGFTSTPITTP